MGERQRYRIVEKIDTGGMAEIYKAVVTTVDGFEKRVAIKRILPSLSDRPKFVKMFLDEARLAMQLNHANIVQVFDVGRAEGTFFLVMEYLEGVNLRRAFQRVTEVGGRFPVPLAIFIVTETLKGLAHAHERRDDSGRPLGIVHRDVSPPNVLLSWAGEVKVTDFGLAKALTQAELTDPGIVKGKFSYLSPEAVDGRVVDHRCDIFSTGILLWELLANRRLFLGRTEMETIEMIRKAEVPPLAPLNPDVTPKLESLVLRALHRDPRKRYQTAREMGDALMAYLFEQGMKVSSYDLAEFLKEIFAEQEVPDEGYSLEKIGSMLNEEILSLSMIRFAGKPLPVDGSSPIDIGRLPSAGRIQLQDLESLGKTDTQVQTAHPGPQGTPLVEKLEGRETLPMSALRESPESRRRWLWLGLGILLAAALGIGGYLTWELWLKEMLP